MSGPRKNLLVDLWLASSLAQRLVEQTLVDTPMSPEEFALYGLIVDLGPVTSTQLGRWTGMAATTLSALIRRCEARGELERRANPADRRSSHLVLTDQGMALYRRCLPALGDTLTALIDNLPCAESEARNALQDIDSALRLMSALDPRPYQLEAGGDDHQLAYSGPPLTSSQRAEAIEFVHWLRHRDSS